MIQGYFTYHKGVAGFLILQGHQIINAKAGKNPKNGRDIVTMEFDCDRDEGKKLADRFFAGAAQGTDLKRYYDALGEVQQVMFKARKG